jgi:hypothetical protein
MEPFLEDLIKETSPAKPVEVLETHNLEDLVAEDLEIPNHDEEVENVRDTEASGASRASKVADTSEISTPLLPTPDSTPEPALEPATEVENNELEPYD